MIGRFFPQVIQEAFYLFMKSSYCIGDFYLFQSHSTFQAHWVGECQLPWEERKLHLHLLLTEPDDETILDGMDALSTQS